MKFVCPLIVVNDMAASKKFYSDVLNLEVIIDYGANVTLTGGLSLQTKESWAKFIDKNLDEIRFRSNDSEIYFEAENLDEFLLHLRKFDNIVYLHQVKTYEWGQRVVRFYDPDFHIIEVGENMKNVCRRYLSQGYTVEQTAFITQQTEYYVKECL